MQIEQTAELNLVWGSLILEELSRLGVQHICMAPGSRSTPLTLAAAKQSNLQQHLHFDERGLGFMALGLAKASRAPVAIITTSGTAVANLYPAIIEAWLTQVPLIVLSGDRPPELIECGANQAIIQPGIFAHYARQVNLPTPDLAIPAPALLSLVGEAVSNQTQPIHINCMYREPLYPSEIQADFSRYLNDVAQWQASDQPYTQYAVAGAGGMPTSAELSQFSDAKGIIVAATIPAGDTTALIALSKSLGWPIVADAQSQLRQHPEVIGHIDQLLLQPKARKQLTQAEHVLVFGGRVLSKRLIDYLSEQNWLQYWQVLPTQQRLDPSHKSKKVWLSSLQAFAELPWPASSCANWAQSINVCNHELEGLFKLQIDQGEFGEAQVVRAIAQHQHANSQLFIGNSLPVRLYDMYAPISLNQANIYTNRGASGIDGLLATASGIAAHNSQATTLIIGDISQLHDLNSLAITRTLTGPFVIVVLNNDGGNIFNLLPVPTEALRKDYYRLAHGLEFGYAAAMFGLMYQQVDSLDDFNHIYQAAIASNGATLIEVTVAQDQASQQISRIRDWIKQS